MCTLCTSLIKNYYSNYFVTFMTQITPFLILSVFYVSNVKKTFSYFGLVYLIFIFPLQIFVFTFAESSQSRYCTYLLNFRLFSIKNCEFPLSTLHLSLNNDNKKDYYVRST